VLIEARRRADEGAIGAGFTATKKIGGAVVRNRARRRLREAARRLLPELGLAGVDYVFVARQSTPAAPWASLLDDVRNALIRLRADLTSGRTGGRRRAGKPAPKNAIESD
jgi:ribonuclease P protein component